MLLPCGVVYALTMSDHTDGPALADRALIEDLYTRFGWTLDTADIDGFAALFTPSAVIEDAFAGRYEGPDAARRFAIAMRDRPDFPGRQHWTNQSLFERDEDGWRVRSFGIATQRHPEGAIFLPWVGHTDDRVVGHDGAWLFAERRFLRWSGDVLAGFPGRS
jgi:hypothetical protein